MTKKVVAFSILIIMAISAFSQVNLVNTFGDKKHNVITSTISYDGTLLATAGDDNELIVWNIQSGSVYRRLTGLSGWTKSIAFSRDGKYIVSGGKESKVCIWDIERASIVYSFTGHSGDVNAVVFSADNSLVASGGADKTIRIWNVKTGSPVTTLTQHSRDVTSIDFCPSSTRMVSGSADGKLIIWATSNWSTESQINAHKGWVRAVAFSPDGSTIASSGDDRVIKTFDSRGIAKATMTGHKNWVQSLSFSSDGKYIVSGSHDQTFIVWNVDTGSQVYQSPSQGEIVYSVNFSPNGKNILASSLRKRDITLWDASPLNIRASIAVAQPQPTTSQAITQVVTTKEIIDVESPTLQLKSVNFFDPNRNNTIDAGEHTALEVTVANTGKGTARGVKLFVAEQNNVKGLDFGTLFELGDLLPNTEKKHRIAVVAADYVYTGSANFRFSITESRGYNTNPVELAVATKKLEVPMVVLHEYAFQPINSDLIAKGSKFKLSMIVQNKGDAVAQNVRVRFELPENAFIVSDPEFSIAQLTPNEFKAIDIEVMTNTRYMRPDVPIEVFVSESTGKYGDRKIASARLNEGAQGNINSPLLAISPRTSVQPQTPPPQVSALSDVDVDIPKVGKPDPNRYALIIGNEDYSSHQKGLKTESNVEFAVRDAEIFKLYALNVLRVPEDNIIFRTNATAMEMHRALSQINSIAKIKEGKAEIFVMYAGHGFPDEKTQEPYLIPVDVSGADLQFAIKLTEFYGKLTEHPTKRVTVFLDACFSGGGREQGLIAARGVRVRPKENALTGNLVVFAATSGDQSALPWKDKNHGMFTYHLLQKLKESKGDISYGELSDYLRTTVGTRSVIVNQKEQNPQTNVSGDVVDTWNNWKFK